MPIGSGFDDLGDKPIYANPVTIAYDNLKRVSEERQKAGKPPLIIKAAELRKNPKMGSIRTSGSAMWNLR